MAKADRKSEGTSSKTKSGSQDIGKLEKTVTVLQEENADLKVHIRRVESRLDSFIAKMNKNSVNKPPGNKTKAKEESGNDKDSQ